MSTLVKLTSGMVGARCAQPFASTSSSTATSLAPLARVTPNDDDRLVEQPRERARLGGAVGPACEFVEPHLAAAGQRDRRGGEIGDGARAGQRADRLFLAGDFAASAAEVDVVGAHLRVDVAAVTPSASRLAGRARRGSRGRRRRSA